MVRLTPEQYDQKNDIPRDLPRKKGDTPSFMQSKYGFILEVVKIVVITLAIILPVRYFLFQPFYVRGASMEPSFHDKDYLIIDEITYRLSEPKRGDVVVVRNPNDAREFFIKRIIGLPNETVEIQNNTITIFNVQSSAGTVLDESYLSTDTFTSGNSRVVLSDDQYFIMGDNRSVSLDSRVFGPLPRENIIGRAWLRVWPFKTFQHFTPPTYQLITNESNV